MNNYTIHCTQEQTKKALELGAPIILSEKREVYNNYPQEIPGKIGKYLTFEEAYSCCFCNNHGAYIIPTTDQLIGWLESQGVLVDVEMRTGIIYVYDRKNKTYVKTIQYSSRKDSILSAIDAALEYLTIED